MQLTVATKKELAGHIRRLKSELGHDQPPEGFENEHTEGELGDWIIGLQTEPENF